MPHFNHTWVWMAPKKKLVDLQSVGHKTAHNIHNKCNEALKAAAQRQWTIWRELGYARGLRTHCLYANSFSHDGILFRHQFIQHVFGCLKSSASSHSLSIFISIVVVVVVVVVYISQTVRRWNFLSVVLFAFGIHVALCSVIAIWKRIVKIHISVNEVKPKSRFSTMKNIHRNGKSNVCYQSTAQTQYQVF